LAVVIIPRLCLEVFHDLSLDRTQQLIPNRMRKL
jgi:hypothetical protein